MVSGSKNGSKDKNNRGQKPKQKLVFAKDRNQAILAIVIIAIFIANTSYMVIKYFMEQIPKPVQQAGTQQTADAMAKQQQKNLESLANQNSGSEPVQGQDIAEDANNIYSKTIGLQKPPNQNAKSSQPSEEGVEIIPKKSNLTKNQKMVLISVGNSGRSNPFLPAYENVAPSSSLSYLTAPPETLKTGSEASKIMTTIISGILYDKYSPSAIINIEGTDYLVKRGDIINHYKILSIDKTQVLVQLGKNVYRAGVGELLSQTNLNYNTISNLNKKFGGNYVSISVKKKGY
ncbi:MAG: hypothetical protein WCY19_06355 [Candidatus Gastranaerophilaceae bacterium]